MARGSSDISRLVALVSEALSLADALGQVDVGIMLNEALVELDGNGRVPDHAAEIGANAA